MMMLRMLGLIVKAFTFDVQLHITLDLLYALDYNTLEELYASPYYS